MRRLQGVARAPPQQRVAARFRQRPQNAGLSDAGFSRDQHGLSESSNGQPKPVAEGAERVFALDELAGRVAAQHVPRVPACNVGSRRSQIGQVREFPFAAELRIMTP